MMRKAEEEKGMKNYCSYFFLFAMILLAACNQDNTPPDNPKNNETSNNRNHEQNEMVQKIESLPFYKFELEVEYPDDQDVNIELERNPSGNIDVEYLDPRNDIRLYGKEAFDLLYPKLKNLTIDETSTKEQAVSEAKKVFELEDNYLELEMKVIFNDSTQLEIDERK